MKRTLLLFLLLFSTVAVFAQTALKGKVTDEDTGEGLPFATVKLLRNGAYYQGSQTDFDGNYRFSNIDPGTYDLQVEFTGYPDKLITGVVVNQGKTNNVDILTTNSGGVNLDEIVVIGYEVPLVEQDNTTQGQTITAEEIRNLPTRNINQIASTVAGATSSDEGEAINIRGSRSNATDYYVDGVRVSAVSIPDAEIEQLQVVTGGIEARYGDVTGGIISITTKGFSDEFTVSAEAETSEGLDNFGQSLIGGAISGPLLRDKSDRAVLGYRLSGRYTYQEDDDPSAVPIYKVRDDVLADLQANPLRQIDNNTFVAADFLTNDDVNILRTRPNEAASNINLNGKLTARLSEAIDISLSGAYRNAENQFTPGENSRTGADWRLLNSDRNPTTFTDNYRVNLAFRHRLGGEGTSQASEDGRSDLLRNASYDLQFTYENIQQELSDPIHGDNFFDYGHVASFQREFIPVFQDSTFVNEFGLLDTTYRHIDYREVLRGIDGDAGSNPVLFNYNAPQLADPLFAERNSAIAGEPDMTVPISAFNAINGQVLSIYNNSYGFHTNVGQVYNLYQTSRSDRFTFQANASFDIVPGEDAEKSRHSIQLGVWYEQRTDRAYSLNPFSLWRIARQLSNAPLETVDTNNAVVGTRILQDGNAYDVYAPTVSTNDGTFFNRVRSDLGVAENEYINIDGLDPSQLSLAQFSPDELVSNNILDYYGYDYLGNEYNGSFDDFFDVDPTTGNRTFLVAPNRPIYAAAYLQDKFTINDMIFRLGVRVDRYDANTRVLRDPFSLYAIQGAADFHGNVGTDRPGNIGDDFAVYVNEQGGDEVVAYRDDETWYFPNGNPANGFQEINGLQSGLVFPAYENDRANDPGGQFIKSEDFQVESAFKDYEVQFNVMPRLSFSFPISDDANFFAHYDVLVQRPPGNTITTALDYFYFPERAGGRTFNNANLRSERTIDYEVGFKTILTQKSALSITAYYKELRDMIQLRTYVPVPIVNQYTTYDNQDFATVKGFSFTYDLRRTSNFRVNANYTLQFADGTGSNANSQRGLTSRGNLRTLFPLTFDERHRINLVLDYRLPNSATIPKALQGLGANIQGSAVSGRPYTATQVPGELSGSTTIGAINGARKPANFIVNAQINKDFEFGNGSRVNLYLRVSNLLDRRNVINVYSATGSVSDPGYLQSSFGQDNLEQISQSPRPVESYLASYQWKVLSPDFFSLPRRIFVGAVFGL